MRSRRTSAQVTMIRAAYWTCVLAALAHARVYERCELARDLLALGVPRDDLSVWVCITFHESRFDTAAQNGYSGDHGLFQISELYWCGPGKACGLPCSALRDEDISDDLECALKIREEHDRLQGNGFLAWVVYPQHCKHNTKKYIVDCDGQLKNATVQTPSSGSRAFSNTYNDKYSSFEQNSTSTFENFRPNIDSQNSKPSFLIIANSLFRGGSSKVLEGIKKQKSIPNNVLSFNTNDIYQKADIPKIVENIDELILPDIKYFEGFPRFGPPVTTTTLAPTTRTSTTSYPTYSPLKVWRRIESNQFRKKLVVDKKPTPLKELELGKPTSYVDFTPSTYFSNAGFTSSTSSARKPSTTEAASVYTTTTTPAPRIDTIETFTTLSPVTSSVYKQFDTTKTTAKPTIWSQFSKTNYEPFVYTTTSTKATKPTPYSASTYKSSVSTSTTIKPTASPFSTYTNKPFDFFSTTTTPKAHFITTTRKPFVFTSTTAKPTKSTFNSYTYTPFNLFSTTTKPTTSAKFSTSTSKPFVFTSTTSKPTGLAEFRTSTYKPLDFTSTTSKPTALAEFRTSTYKPFVFTTPKPPTPKFNNANSINNFGDFKPFVFSTAKPNKQTTYKTAERTAFLNSANTKTPKTFDFNGNSPSGTKRIEITNHKDSYSSTQKTLTTFNFIPITTRKSFTAPEHKQGNGFSFNSLTTTTIKPTISNHSSGSIKSNSDQFKSFRSSRTSKLFLVDDTAQSTNQPRGSFAIKPVAKQNFPLPTTSPLRSIANVGTFGSSAQRGISKPVQFSSPFAPSINNSSIKLTATPTLPPIGNIATQKSVTTSSQSIFDLYLNPTQRPKLPFRNFPNLRNSVFNLKIFSDGTTPAPYTNTRQIGSLGRPPRNLERHLTPHT